MAKLIIPTEAVQLGIGRKFHIRRHEEGSTDKTRCDKIIWEDDPHNQTKPIEAIPPDQLCKRCLGPLVATHNDPVPIQDGTTIHELLLTPRPFNMLERYGITTIEELATMTTNDLLALRGLGPVAIDEIKQKLLEWQFANDREAQANPENQLRTKP